VVAVAVACGVERRKSEREVVEVEEKKRID